MANSSAATKIANCQKKIALNPIFGVDMGNMHEYIFVIIDLKLLFFELLERNLVSKYVFCTNFKFYIETKY